MQTYDDTGVRSFLIGCVVLLISFGVPVWLGNALGYEEEVTATAGWIRAQELWLCIVCLAAQAALGFVILFAALGAAYWSIAALLDAGRRLAEWLMAAIGKLLESVKLALLMMARFYLGLLTLPFRLIGRFAAKLIGTFHQRLADERKLQALYRAEYAADFKSYAAFKRYFKAVQRGEHPTYPGSEEEADAEPEIEDEPVRDRGPKSDPYQEALAVLGLKEPFTQAMFKAVYRARMKEVHPDKTGNDAAAIRLNAARDLIKQRRGW